MSFIGVLAEAAEGASAVEAESATSSEAVAAEKTGVRKAVKKKSRRRILSGEDNDTDGKSTDKSDVKISEKEDLAEKIEKTRARNGFSGEKHEWDIDNKAPKGKKSGNSLGSALAAIAEPTDHVSASESKTFSILKEISSGIKGTNRRLKKLDDGLKEQTQSFTKVITDLKSHMIRQIKTDGDDDLKFKKGDNDNIPKTETKNKTFIEKLKDTAKSAAVIGGVLAAGAVASIGKAKASEAPKTPPHEKIKDHEEAHAWRFPTAGKPQQKPSNSNSNSSMLEKIASSTSMNETGVDFQKDPSKALGQIANDTGKSKSYGFMGLNDKTGSLQTFVKDHPELGLTEKISSPEFDKHWKKLSEDPKTQEIMKKAQLAHYEKHSLQGGKQEMKRLGLSEKLQNDAGVTAYFADRVDQQGKAGSKSVQNVLKAHPEDQNDSKKFLKDLSESDKGNLDNVFTSYLKQHPENKKGLEKRVDNRLNQAMAIDNNSNIKDLNTKIADAPAAQPKIVVNVPPAKAPAAKGQKPGPRQMENVAVNNVPNPSAGASSYEYLDYFGAHSNRAG